MGPWIVSASIWVALLCYLAGPLGLAASSDTAQRRARWIWTLGCTAFLVHVVSSFDVFYDWSHATALHETALQVAELTGRPSGAGLYVNYIFTAIWLIDAAWWWFDPTGYARRSWVSTLLLHGFFLFMIFNATVVFEDGATRIFGLAVTAIGTVATWKAVTRARSLR